MSGVFATLFANTLCLNKKNRKTDSKEIGEWRRQDVQDSQGLTRLHCLSDIQRGAATSWKYSSTHGLNYKNLKQHDSHKSNRGPQMFTGGEQQTTAQQ